MIMIEPNEEPFEPGGGRENPEVWYIQIVLIDSFGSDPIDLILYYERQARRRQKMASVAIVRMTWVMPE